MSARSECRNSYMALVANRRFFIFIKLSASSYMFTTCSRDPTCFTCEINGMFHFIVLLFRVLTTARHSRTVLVNYFSNSHKHIFRRKCEWNTRTVEPCTEPDDATAIHSITNCLSALNKWMNDNFLKLNEDKTEVQCGPKFKREI